MTNDKLYLEHVTNYIYSHPNKFKIDWIEVDPRVYQSDAIRLTIDTQNDFNNCFLIYSKLIEGKLEINIENILSLIYNDKTLQRNMKQEIIKNSK